MRETLRGNPTWPRTHMATSGTAGSGDPDMALISELLEDIQRNPPAIAARKLLTEHYIAIGWLDAAGDNIKDLKESAPRDSDVKRLAEMVERKPEPPAAELTQSRTKATTLTRVEPASMKRISARPVPQLNGNLDSARKDLTEGYTSLRVRAKSLLADMLHLQALQKKNGSQQLKNTARIQAIVDGRKFSQTARTAPSGSARVVARTMQGTPEKATEIAIADLEDTMHWIRQPNGKLSNASDDTVRDAFVKRMHVLQSALPEYLKVHCELALMHIVHENLDKDYANTETMLGDLVKDIAREDFYVTEDNYAWDMTELVQAIRVNGGVMRNPLSKQMFTPKDVRGILLHKHGKPLAALQVEQREMSKGVRLETIAKMEELGKALLEDQSADQMPSRHKIDEFLAYVATLPEPEQKAIEGFRAPAKDSHTGNTYDFSIGQAVRDAKGNLVCFHKTGDFINQAAAYLRRNQGAPPDPDKCLVM